MDFNVIGIYIAIALILIAVVIIAVFLLRRDSISLKENYPAEKKLDDYKNIHKDLESFISTEIQKEIDEQLREEQERYADEARRLNEENEELKKKLEESAKYTKQLDLEHVERAIRLAEQNKELKEQLNQLRSEYETNLENEKKELAKNIEEEKKQFIERYADSRMLSDAARLNLEKQKVAFAKKMEDSKSIVTQQLDSTYEEMAKLVENERLELLHKQDVERYEMSKKLNSEKDTYRKMLADLNEENTNLERQLDEERLAYAQKLYDARKNFDEKLKAEKLSNAKLMEAFANSFDNVANKDDTPEPVPDAVEVDPEVIVTRTRTGRHDTEEEKQQQMEFARKQQDKPKHQRASANLIFAEDGVVNLKLAMRESVQQLQDVVNKYGVGVSLKFGEMTNAVVYADENTINRMIVGLIQDVAASSYRNSTMEISIKQRGPARYGRGDYEYSCKCMAEKIEFNPDVVEELGGKYSILSNEDGSKTLNIRFTFELR